LITVSFSPVFLLGPFVFLAPLALASRAWRRRGATWLFLGLFYGVYFHKFPASLGHYWGRYQHPLAPLVLTGMTLGLGALIRRLRRRSTGGRTALSLGLATAFLLGAGLGGELQHALYRSNIRAVGPGGQVRQMLNWLRANTQPDDVIAAHDIGYLSYFANRPIVDLVGLTDPEIAEIHRAAGPPCGGPRPRAKDLYWLLERRGVKLVLMAPEWQNIYLGLANFDNGQHMRLVRHFGPPKTPFTFRGQVNGYDAYACDWSK
jgi:hypothetical protein